VPSFSGSLIAASNQKLNADFKQQPFCPLTSIERNSVLINNVPVSSRVARTLSQCNSLVICKGLNKAAYNPKYYYCAPSEGPK
jgi:hypothetical protein